MSSYPTYPNPQISQISVLFDPESGVWRPVLKSDYAGTESVQNVNVKAPNGENLATINPLPVRMGGSSASAFGETLTVEQNPEIEGYLSSINDNISVNGYGDV